MKTETNKLAGAALDWAVAKCEGHEIDSLMGGAVWYWLKCSLTGAPEVVEVFRPSSDWSFGGPILEREKISVKYFPDGGHPNGGEWWAYWDADPQIESYGETPLIAALRCYVQSRQGDAIDVPPNL
jgi:hypothetical protein